MFFSREHTAQESQPAPAQAARVQSASGKATNAEFEQVVERYHGKVFQLVYRYTGDYEEACDLTQDTFVRAFNAWNEFRGDSQVYTWLYRIALNLCHNQQKRIVRRNRMERWSLDTSPDDDFEGGRGPIEVADERPLPLARIEGDEMRLRLREALAQLPENYRMVIVLRDIEGLTYDEIARVTDSTLEAIKSRLFRARQTLRRILEPYMTGGLESEWPSNSQPSSEAVQTQKTPVWNSAVRADIA
ncbi:RNA polymerase sigma-70 factor, ECF subfamily [Abditibacterium utsteinense]|uniref:RNA polymerase sigma-70 factor, ECF subfamily n=1 Tax=Abditibacterium utsteinense TaxID=1960156 RepID=A0A2S8SPR1_9BACT|nr:sigma-70 family RNA polymerase sigma factor [Abditibacterium utsteinense]PQV62778.1 RNA polymerase sigma-70 factor, ECF subfamily [Abditibacterium utsteinense]